MPYSNVELLLRLVAQLTRGERVDFYLRLRERYYGTQPPYYAPGQSPPPASPAADAAPAPAEPPA